MTGVEPRRLATPAFYSLPDGKLNRFFTAGRGNKKKPRHALACRGFLVPLTGVEPVRYFYRGILSPLCLPIPPQRRSWGVASHAPYHSLFSAVCQEFLGCFMVKPMRFFATSTDNTHTLTMSPTFSTSEGCLIKRLVIWEICTRPS